MVKITIEYSEDSKKVFNTKRSVAMAVDALLTESSDLWLGMNGSSFYPRGLFEEIENDNSDDYDI